MYRLDEKVLQTRKLLVVHWIPHSGCMDFKVPTDNHHETIYNLLPSRCFSVFGIFVNFLFIFRVRTHASGWKNDKSCQEYQTLKNEQKKKCYYHLCYTQRLCQTTTIDFGWLETVNSTTTVISSTECGGLDLAIFTSSIYQVLFAKAYLKHNTIAEFLCQHHVYISQYKYNTFVRSSNSIILP